MYWSNFTQTLPAHTTVAGDGSAYIAFPNQLSGYTYRIEQVTLSTKAFPAVLMALSQGVFNTPTELICSTSVFTGASVAGVISTSTATAIGPPYVYLQEGQSLIAALWGGTAGDTFSMLMEYTLGSLAPIA